MEKTVCFAKVCLLFFLDIYKVLMVHWELHSSFKKPTAPGDVCVWGPGVRILKHRHPGPWLELVHTQQ